tara:strand:+ start:86 stop:301 length:216 start_codon:yes stop_codon:yes gene_type:complete
MQKRSITIAKHRTSICIENEFWEILDSISAEKNITIPKLIEIIEKKSDKKNLSSAIRVFCLTQLNDAVKNS